MIDLFKQLDSLGLPKTDHGLIPALENDLDIIARNSAWKKAMEYTTPITGEVGDLIINLFNGRIQVFNEWSYIDKSANEIINNAEFHNGYP